MPDDIKAYHFQKGRNADLDQEFARTKTYSKVKPGETALFWKAGLKWYHIPLSQVQHICHRKETHFQRIACGGMDFTTDFLILELRSGTSLNIHIGDNIHEEGDYLFSHLKAAHPDLSFSEA